MWIKLLVTKVIERQGKMVRFRPGDWVDVGRQYAMTLVASGEATIPSRERANLLLPHKAGILCWSVPPGHFSETFKEIEIKTIGDAVGSDILRFRHSLVCDPGAIARTDLIAVGFNLLAHWQIAVPLESYELLAAHLGNKHEQEATQKIVRDLRVPVYDTRVIFVRRCEDTAALFDLWFQEKRNLPGGDVRLAFLRALYQTKPLICALPVNWCNH